MSTREGRAALLAAVPAVDILVNNNGGPPPRDFRELDHAAILAGLEANMVAPIELIQAVSTGWWRGASAASSTSPRAR